MFFNSANRAQVLVAAQWQISEVLTPGASVLLGPSLTKFVIFYPEPARSKTDIKGSDAQSLSSAWKSTD